MKKKNFHLNEEQLIYSIMDQTNTPAEIRRHLYHCSVCREKRALLKSELNALGQMADKCAPIPQKKLQIPLSSPGYRFQISNFNPMVMTGIALALLMVVVSWYVVPMTYQQYKTAKILKEMEADQNFMVEIRYLEENALPDAYHDISVESYGYFDEEFLDFVVPLEENSGIQSVAL